jgi:hypothetical protein
MKKILPFAIAFCFLCGLLGNHAHAKEVTITLNDNEVQALLALLDLAAKQGGMRAAGPVTHFAKKLQPTPAAPIVPAAKPAAKPEEKKPVVQGVK